jgi:hypothetical protein
LKDTLAAHASAFLLLYYVQTPKRLHPRVAVRLSSGIGVGYWERIVIPGSVFAPVAILIARGSGQASKCLGGLLLNLRDCHSASKARQVSEGGGGRFAMT